MRNVCDKMPQISENMRFAVAGLGELDRIHLGLIKEAAGLAGPATIDRLTLQLSDTKWPSLRKRSQSVSTEYAVAIGLSYCSSVSPSLVEWQAIYHLPVWP
jgi:hypothetical protein